MHKLRNHKLLSANPIEKTNKISPNTDWHVGDYAKAHKIGLLLHQFLFKEKLIDVSPNS